GLGNDERQIIGGVEKKRLYELSLASENAVEAEMTQEGE
ncbi:phage recombination protein Bet, partial [Salmonella enterica subsp. enterica serovar Give]|nr:phage recombination protein Bet [Salmonella enterica subsp. enterica serovar Give]